MKICLVSPPTVTDFMDPGMAESEVIGRFSEVAPLGILSLAAVLERLGTTPHLVDLNQLYYDYLRCERPPANSGGFLAYLTRYFESRSFDVFGLSTMCSSYALTIRLAREIKRLYPGSAVILGGPQASVVDVRTLDTFPFIDFIVRGEAEGTLPRLLDGISGAGGWEHLAGITFRRRGEVVRNPDAPAIRDLDALPIPAYHLYPYMQGAHRATLELGRGCPFACKFCSTSGFFRHDFRLKSPERVIGEMKAIKETYGVKVFELIHDMFTADRRRVAAFCEALLACGEEFHWSCSARTDCVDDELIDLMATAGCGAIFFGIETGTPRMQKLTNKRLNLGEAIKRIECTDRHRMRTAVSLITGFPDETMEDLDGTIGFYIDALRFDQVQLQLHILAPLGGTAYHSEYRERLVLDDVFSDLSSYQASQQDPADRELIIAYPEMFSNFYAVPTALDRPYLKQFRDFLLYGTHEFRWLLVALQQDSGRLTRVFDEWRLWHAAQKETAAASGSDSALYHWRPEYRREFFQFVKYHYIPRLAGTRSAISALVDFASFYAEVAQSVSDVAAATVVEDAGPPVFSLDSVPMLAPGVFLAELEAGYNEVVECLRTRGRLDLVSTGPVVMAARAVSGKRLAFIQLTGTAAELIRHCGGRRSIREIAYACSAAGVDFEGISPEEACVSILGLLRQQGLVNDLKIAVVAGHYAAATAPGSSVTP